MKDDWLPKWFNIEYEEAKDSLFSPGKYTAVKIFQLLVQIPFLLLWGILMLFVLVFKKGYNFIIRDGKGLLAIIKILQRIRKCIK